MKTGPFSAFTALVLLLGGCTSVSQDPFLTAATGPSAAGPALSSEVSPEFATAVLPSPASVVSVSQTIAGNGLQQTIVFANRTSLAGDNALTVDFGTADTDSRYLHAPSRREITAEMRSAMPGVAMQIQDIIGDNAQGIFGYATGPAGGRGSCLYGWQLVKGGGLVAKSYAAQVRLRYCDPSMGEGQIVSLMQGLQVRPVTRQTIDMLRLAGKSGPTTIARYAAPSGDPDVTERESTPVRRTVRRAPVSDEPTSTDIASSVAIPLPGGQATAATVEKGSETAAEVATPVRVVDNAATVPLPR